MKKLQVDHYGVHQSPNGLNFLIQEDEQNERGLNVQSNIKVRTYRSASPTHAITLVFDGLPSSDDRTLLSWLEGDRLGKLLLPDPDNAGQIVFVDETTIGYTDNLVRASRLSSSTKPPVTISWMMTLAEARLQARLTNVQPYIIFGVTPAWMASLGDKIVQLFEFGSRPLILVGSEDVVLPPKVKRLRGTAFRKISERGLSLEAIGGHYLREKMRHG